MKIYLCGPINACTDSECKDWREEVKSKAKVECLDPMRRDYRGMEGNNVDAIVEGDKADVDECDVIVVYYPKPSVGTSMEMLYAWERKKYIILINKSDAPLSPWLIYHSHVIYSSVAEVLDYLKGYCCGEATPQ